MPNNPVSGVWLGWSGLLRWSGLDGLCSGGWFFPLVVGMWRWAFGSGVADLQPGFNYGSVHCLIPDGGGVFF